jgi:hypothetical protein
MPQGRGGGLWGDDAGQSYGARGMDPRAARRGSASARAGSARGRSSRSSGWDAYEDDTASTGKTLAMGFGAVVMALLLGGGAAYGYWMFSTPKSATTSGSNTPAVSSPATTTGTPSKTPSGTPGATPGTTPHASTGSGTRTVWVTSDRRVL